MTEDDLAELMKSKMMSTSATYESNLQAFGYASEDDPSPVSYTHLIKIQLYYTQKLGYNQSSHHILHAKNSIFRSKS